MGEFLVVTQRVDSFTGLENPFVAWSQTEKLIASDLIDSDGALEVLKAEAAANGGHLSLDKKPHYILHSEE